MRPSLIFSFGFALALLATACTSPRVVRSPEGIRTSLLKDTPVGSSREQVSDYIRREGLDWVHSAPVGFRKETWRKAGKGLATDYETVGSSSVSAKLGTYISGPLMTTYVVAYWGFDANGRLVDVWVRKDVDSL